MKKSILTELSNYIIDQINDEVIDNTNRDEWHFLLFNQDYYIIGYFEASEWLKNHEIDAFEAVGICQNYENENFGTSKIYDNSETTVNMLAYIYGEEILSKFKGETVEELKEEMENNL